MKPPLRIEWGDEDTFNGEVARVWGIDDAEGTRVVETDTGVYPPDADSARRIVASVNLLAEFSVERLEEILSKGDPVDGLTFKVGNSRRIREVQP